MKKKKVIKDKEWIILDYMGSVGGTATPNEISEKTGVSYVTVKKYLDKLVKEEILVVKDGKEEKD